MPSIRINQRTYEKLMGHKQTSFFARLTEDGLFEILIDDEVYATFLKHGVDTSDPDALEQFIGLAIETANATQH
jgi:hypothetical protein